jgi:hypothetical protein
MYGRGMEEAVRTASEIAEPTACSVLVVPAQPAGGVT